jgi:hypothetical protein
LKIKKLNRWRNGTMKKAKTSLTELLKKNREELLKDKEQLEKIEKRIEEKYIAAKMGNM